MPERTSRPLVVGLAGGFASGLLGVGGGFVMVPLLVAWLRFDRRLAHAVSLAAIAPVAVVGAGVFLADGEVDVPLALILAGAGIAGSLIGVRLIDRIDERTLGVMFAAFAFLAGLRMLVA